MVRSHFTFVIKTNHNIGSICSIQGYLLKNILISNVETTLILLLFGIQYHWNPEAGCFMAKTTKMCFTAHSTMNPITYLLLQLLYSKYLSWLIKSSSQAQGVWNYCFAEAELLWDQHDQALFKPLLLHREQQTILLVHLNQRDNFHCNLVFSQPDIFTFNIS